MEAGDSGTRQSGFTSASRPDIFHPRPRDPAERQSREVPSMAAAALMSPAAAYHSHSYSSLSPPYGHGHGHHGPPPPSMPSMISLDESRRHSMHDAEPAQRQSLPSISEVFSSANKSHPYSPTTPTTMGPSQNLPPPPPFGSSVSSRAEAGSGSGPGPESRPPPSHEDKFSRHPQRQEGPPSGPSSSAYPYGDQRELPKPPDSLQRNGNHSNNPPPPPQVPYTQPGQYPPGQLPLSAAPPISPRHFGPPIPPPFEHQRPQQLHSDDEFGAPRRYDPNSLNRHFETWSYTDGLQRIQFICRTICNFAEAYGNIASEQHGGHPIPERLPTEREVSEMLSNADYLRKSLENVRELVQHSLAEKAREGGKHKGPYDDDDISMYGDGMKQHYSLGEVKKRRGRAAPPGRCHSCNRIDTPEWRRGPDGARTLCNACGLHYAKLERKRQMEQRALRPKAVE
ncbi:uncharacterized protein BCR38DRAFT_139605 [Pseudomassariella vexata]|uniref:GATA-type domain-containing protein n=1 Tax=Pseudomassariella vexata TaxID=1141098 RepID=A0A1Y2EB80_9PEZI|nr:uncharacterized protein BCR38DRAFT_139605 [Pseudomassariella vexata]ORY68820.1 hypothetical protein BCR38DRAFT_139605 [Pseudomassariella vexata]